MTLALGGLVGLGLWVGTILLRCQGILVTVSSIFARVSRNFHDSCTGSPRGAETVGWDNSSSGVKEFW